MKIIIKAFEYFHKSLKVKEDPGTYLMLGQYYKANKLEDARNSFLKAIELDGLLSFNRGNKS